MGCDSQPILLTLKFRYFLLSTFLPLVFSILNTLNTSLSYLSNFQVNLLLTRFGLFLNLNLTYVLQLAGLNRLATVCTIVN